MTDSASRGSASLDVNAIRAALQGLSESFAMDGYTVIVAGVERGCLKIQVEAGKEACAECLVPQDIMAEMIKALLPSDVGVSSIDIVCPG